jgi:hypothetical protein
MGSDALHRSARNALARLARARIDNDAFRWEAAEVGVHNRRHLTAALTGQPGEATA